MIGGGGGGSNNNNPSKVDVVEGLVCFDYDESYAGSSIAIRRLTQRRQVSTEKPDQCAQPPSILMRRNKTKTRPDQSSPNSTRAHDRWVLLLLWAWHQWISPTTDASPYLPRLQNTFQIQSDAISSHIWKVFRDPWASELLLDVDTNWKLLPQEVFLGEAQGVSHRLVQPLEAQCDFQVSDYVAGIEHPRISVSAERAWNPSSTDHEQ